MMFLFSLNMISCINFIAAVDSKRFVDLSKFTKVSKDQSFRSLEAPYVLNGFFDFFPLLDGGPIRNRFTRRQPSNLNNSFVENLQIETINILINAFLLV